MSRQMMFSSNKVLTWLLVLCGVGLLLTTPLAASSPVDTPGPWDTAVQTTITQNITTDTTWGISGSPYYIPQDIYVEPGVTLTIEPGVQVLLSDRVKLHVGREGVGGAILIAKGTPTQNITFTRVDSLSRWKTIRHYAGSISYYRYVNFTRGGKEEASLYYQGPGNHVLNNCTIDETRRNAIYATGGGLNLRIAGTYFSSYELRAVSADNGANVYITGSEILPPEPKIAIHLRAFGAPATITVRDSKIVSEGDGVRNELPGAVCVDAQYNWWGSNTGPSGGGGGACSPLGSGPGYGTPLGLGVDWQNFRTSAAQAPRVGITTPPTATFTLTPTGSIARPVGTLYTFDASGSADDEDYTSSLGFCWDWEDDGGGCDATTMVASHTYATGGWHTARLVVTDTDSMTDTLTQDILSSWPPTATFTLTQTTWSQIEVDASASDDVEDSPAQLQARWDWEDDGVWDAGPYSVTHVLTHSYGHVGRYWPTLEVQDTDGVTSTLSKSVDVIPPAITATISGSGGTLLSVDTNVQVDVYTDTVAGTVISDGLVITHTPWITVPTGLDAPPGDFTCNGFNLTARSLSGDPVGQISGTYTITIRYDLDYYVGSLGLLASESTLKLYRWSGIEWVLVPFTIDSAQLIATTDSFGDFALVVEPHKSHLPLVLRAD